MSHKCDPLHRNEECPPTLRYAYQVNEFLMGFPVKSFFCIAICEFCIANLKCLKLHYTVCTGTGVVFQGFTVVWFIIFYQKYKSSVSGNWAKGVKQKLLLGQFLNYFVKIAVIHEVSPPCF